MKEIHLAKAETGAPGPEVQPFTLGVGGVERGCPWMSFKGEAGSLEYALQVFDMMCADFGPESEWCMVRSESGWAVVPYRETSEE